MIQRWGDLTQSSKMMIIAPLGAEVTQILL